MNSRFMQGEKKERWQELCEQATKEQDPQKLLKLVQEVDQLLAQKQERVNKTKSTRDPQSTRCSDRDRSHQGSLNLR
jgi:hypothetical protein